MKSGGNKSNSGQASRYTNFATRSAGKISEKTPSQNYAGADKTKTATSPKGNPK